MEFDQIRILMAKYLQEQGIDTLCAYPDSSRVRRGGAAAVVSLRSCKGGPGGFQDYLGERFDETTGQWQELYGRQITITFGLDLYAPVKEGAEAIQTAFDRLAQALQREGPPGLRLLELSCGETQFNQEMGLFQRPVEASCQGYLYAVAQEGGTFLDFIVRGETKL